MEFFAIFIPPYILGIVVSVLLSYKKKQVSITAKLCIAIFSSVIIYILFVDYLLGWDTYWIVILPLFLRLVLFTNRFLCGKICFGL